MGKNLLNYAVLALVPWLMISCATNETKLDQSQISKVKKVAIGGFTLVQEAAIKSNIDVPKMPGSMNSTIPDHNTFARTNTHGANTYIALSKVMKKKKGWKVYPYGRISKNSKYKGYYRELMENWKNRRSPVKDHEMIYAKDVLDYKSFFKLGQTQRDEIMKNLGVDAIAALNIEVTVKSKYGTLNGFGDKKPVSRIEYVLFKRGMKEPIWEATMEPSEGLEPVPSNMFSMDNKQDLMNKVSLKSIKYTFANILLNKKVE